MFGRVIEKKNKHVYTLRWNIIHILEYPRAISGQSLITVLISAGESEKVNLLHIIIYQSVALARRFIGLSITR